MVANERRLVRGRSIRGSLLQLRMDIAQVEEIDLAILCLGIGILLDKISPATNRPNKLKFVIDGVKSREAVNLIGVIIG